MKKRILSLDALRGVTIALMIIVNNPGDYKEMFFFLHHAKWHGFLGADLVFPLFLFIAGYAAALSAENKNNVILFYKKLIFRTVVLFLIGLFLNGYPFGLLPGTEFSVSGWRIFGVLQRIALCYLTGSVILYHFRQKKFLFIILTLAAIAYEIGMRAIQVTDTNGTFGKSFSIATNFSRWVDLYLVGAPMLYKMQNIPFDPEGLFSTITALMSFLFGAIAFRLPENTFANKIENKFENKFKIGILLGGMALLTAIVEPVNKNLWTLPFVFLTGSIAFFLLNIIERIEKNHPHNFVKYLSPFILLGKNPLILYVVTSIIGKTIAFYKVTPSVSLKQVLYHTVFSDWLPAQVGSFLYSLFILSTGILVAYLLARRELYLRV